jgi:hypothetical protein
MTLAIDNPILVATQKFLARYKAKGFAYIESPLLTLMGCPADDSRDEFNFWRQLPDPSFEDMETIQFCYPKLLSLSEGWLADTALIAIAGRHGLWAVCLDNEEHTRKLTSCVLRYLQRYHYNCDIFYDHYAPFVCTLLNEWVKPCIPWCELPTTLSVCRQLFGDGWCTLLSNNGNIVSMNPVPHLAAIVARERPPFLPGLCTAQDNVMSVPLPDDLGFGQ